MSQRMFRKMQASKGDVPDPFPGPNARNGSDYRNGSERRKPNKGAKGATAAKCRSTNLREQKASYIKHIEYTGLWISILSVVHEMKNTVDIVSNSNG